MTKLYAQMFGISDHDLAEAPWLAGWIKRHHNEMRYDPVQFKWVWIGC